MIRETKRTLIIAEAGVNHNGSLEMARALIRKAAEAEADLVKFQAFRAEDLVTSAAPKAEYQQRQTGSEESQRAMIKKLELGAGDFALLQEEARQAGIGFLVSPFDAGSLRLLVEDLRMTTIKLGSGELTHAPFLFALGRTGLEVILSTGMADLEEIREALNVLAAGYLSGARGEAVGTLPRRGAERSPEGWEWVRKKVTLLHCTTEYPCVPEEVNLRAMDTLRAAFALPVGYSDHTEGVALAWAAVARGATVIEKHFTLDRNLPGPDHRASLEPEELKEMVRGIRLVEKALGNGQKGPTATEEKNRAVARRSLVAGQAIAEGELFTRENLTCKRPGTGISPFCYADYLGKPAGRAYLEDELID